MGENFGGSFGARDILGSKKSILPNKGYVG